MLSSFIVIGKIYNMDKSINSRKNGTKLDGSNYESQMIWVNINTQKLNKEGQEKYINKVFTIWDNNVVYAEKLLDGDVVALQCHCSSKQNANGEWSDFWAVDKFEIVGKSRIFADDEKINVSQKLTQVASEFQKEKNRKEKENQEILDADDSILWD